MSAIASLPPEEPGRRPRTPGPGITIRSIEDVERLANLMFKGGCQPAGIDRPEKLAVAILAGLDIGLSPTQAVGSISLTGGKPSVYGDGALALVRASDLLESHSEYVTGEGDDRKGVCVVKRKGEPERTFDYSIARAKRNKLIERAKGVGQWATDPDRMLVMRARGFALRDVFPDVLRGLVTTEEAMDYQDVEVTAVPTALPPSSGQPQLPASSAPASATPVTEEQLQEMRRIFGLAAASRSIPESDTDARKGVVQSILAPLGVGSVRDLTSERASELIQQLGKEYDPFTYGPSGGQPANSGQVPY